MKNMDTAFTGAAARTYVEGFEQLRVSLRETHSADPRQLVDVRVIFNGGVVVYAMGSVELALAALSEAFSYIAPILVPSSYVRVEVRAAGRR